MIAVGTIGLVTAFVGSMICLLVAIANMFRAVHYRKDGVPLFRRWYENPINILFRPGDLTAQGLAARRGSFTGLPASYFVC